MAFKVSQLLAILGLFIFLIGICTIGFNPSSATTLLLLSTGISISIIGQIGLFLSDDLLGLDIPNIPQPILIEKNELLLRIERARIKAKNFQWLHPDEIKMYDSYIKNISDKNLKKVEHDKLTVYLNFSEDRCALSHEAFKLLSNKCVVTFVWNERLFYSIHNKIAIPISTFETGWIKRWIEIKGENALDPAKKFPLKEANLHIGFPQFVVDMIDHVREINSREMVLQRNNRVIRDARIRFFTGRETKEETTNNSPCLASSQQFKL